jgi:hypothetical protein
MGDTPSVARLEDEFVSEVSVVSAIYGPSNDEQTTWALQTLPLDYAEPYLSAWREGRSRAWNRIRQQATELQQAAGDSGAEWQRRLERLQVLGTVAGVELVEPTTRGGAEWS